MTSLLHNVTNGIWHAFNYLTTPNTNNALKSRLKVLTANFATILDLYGVEKGLDHFRSTSELIFTDFKYYLDTEVFSNVPKTISLKQCQILEAKIEDICWLVCQKLYIDQNDVTLNSGTVYQLFRIFCFLSELTPDAHTQNAFKVLMHPSEVSKLSSELAVSLGGEWDFEHFQSEHDPNASFDFPAFLLLVEKHFGQSVASEPLDESVADIYITLTQDVIKKGPLLKRGYLLPTLKEYWFVLQTTELTYFRSGSAESESCGGITLSPHCTVDGPPSTHSRDKSHRIVINGVGTNVELIALDHKSRLQWISAMQLAISHSSGTESYQRRQVNRRRIQRNANVLKLQEETLRRTSQSLEIKATKEKLQEEIKARVAADKKAKELENTLEKQVLEAQELLDVRDRLEILLEEEVNAKRDEEIVRSLQARVLREEWERREELERLQEEQQLMLLEERQKRLLFERLQQQMEANLLAAEERLRALEEERQALDCELQVARDKISQSEQAKQLLERQLKDSNGVTSMVTENTS